MSYSYTCIPFQPSLRPDKAFDDQHLGIAPDVMLMQILGACAMLLPTTDIKAALQRANTFTNASISCFSPPLDLPLDLVSLHYRPSKSHTHSTLFARCAMLLLTAPAMLLKLPWP